MAGTRTMKTTLTLTGVGSEADLEIGNIVSIGDQSTETDELETTTLDSPNGYREFEQGLKDAGSLEFELNNTYNGVASTLRSIFDASEKRDWTVAWPDSDGVTAASLDFNAFIMNVTHGEASIDGIAKLMLTLRISGAPTYAEV